MHRTNISRTLLLIFFVIYLVLFTLLSLEGISLGANMRIATPAAVGLAGAAGLIICMGRRAVKA